MTRDHNKKRRRLKANERPEIKVPQLWQVVVECSDEAEQREMYERLVAAGNKCRLLTL